MFILFWGINYARMPLADSMGLSTEAGYTVSDLQALCQYLIEECNTLRDQVEEDEQGVYRLSHTKQAVMESMYNLYNTYAPAWMNLARTIGRQRSRDTQFAFLYRNFRYLFPFYL